MSSKLRQLETFHKTRLGYLVFGVVELALGYVFVSWAIDSGSLIDWFLGIVLAVGGLQNFFRLIKKLLVKHT